MKERLDVLLVKRNLAASREKAKAIIMAGQVFVDGQREEKKQKPLSCLEMFMWTTRKKINQEQHSQKNLRLKCVAIHCLMSAAADLS
mgnify:CR=1 FL=1